MRLSRLFWVGFIITITSIAFIIGMLYLQEISFKKSNFVFTILLDNVQGLNDGDNVSMLGKRIGKVSKTKILGQNIAVELSIDNSFAFRIPVDSKIEVKSEGLLGEKYVSISPGVDTDHYILAGETVQGTREKDLSEITPGIVPITKDLGAIARRLRATLGENEKNRIQSTIKNIENLTSEIDQLISEFRGTLTDEDKENFHLFIQNMRLISDSLKTEFADKFDSVDIILSDARNITKSVKGKTDTFNESIDKLNQSAGLLLESATSIKTVTGDLQNAVDKLSGVEGTVPKLLNDNGVYNNIDSLIYDIRFVVDDFKENPGRYLKAYMKAKKSEND